MWGTMQNTDFPMLESQLHKKDWRGCLVKSVYLFGFVSLEASSAQGMLPMFWTGCCGDYSWWGSVARSLIPRKAVQSALIPLSGDAPTCRFSWQPMATIPWLSNTQRKPGELQLWCFIKSWVLCWVKLFPMSGFSVYSIENSQPPTDFQTYNSLLAV